MHRLLVASISLALIISGNAVAQSPSKSATASRALAGRVVDHNGQPAANRPIFMQKVGGGLQGRSHTSTNNAGEFRFDNPAPGLYKLSTHGLVDADASRYYRPGDFVTIRTRKGGVITGTVTGPAGEPIIAVPVQITRVRDEDGRRIKGFAPFSGGPQSRPYTDDRGVYRAWGLAPGSYIVSVGGKEFVERHPTSDREESSAPTYHLSATTAGAAVEVRVQDGQELTGIDINHRDESGFKISGYVSGQTRVEEGPGERGVGLFLTDAATGMIVQVGGVQPDDNGREFVFENLADGEYEIAAMRMAGQALDAASANQRVVVKGKDVTGVEVKLSLFGSAEGRLSLEATPGQGCRAKSPAHPSDAVLFFHAKGAPPILPDSSSIIPGMGAPIGTPDDKGAFIARAMRAGRYYVEAQLPNKEWYLSSITLPGSAKSPSIDAARDGINILSGKHVSGLIITARDGAASVLGRVVMASGSEARAAGLRVHLVPAEREQSENVLRFAEAAVEDDNSFQLTNVAPGRYWIVVRTVEDPDGAPTDRAAWDRESRTKLLREAEAAKNLIELKPCQQASDRVITYAPPAVKDQN